MQSKPQGWRSSALPRSPASRNLTDTFVDIFRLGYEAGRRAFNDGDYEVAFGGLSPDVEYRPLASLLETGVMRGRGAIEQYFRSLREANAWQVEPVDYIDAGDGKVVIHLRGATIGRTSGIRNEIEFFELVEIGGDGLVTRMLDFETLEEGLGAAEAA